MPQRQRQTGWAFLVILGWGLSALAATAQTVPPAGTAPAFVIESDDGDNRLQLGGIVHLDGRFTPDDAQGSPIDTFNLRRFRTITQGRLARHFDFFLNVDLAGGVINLRDAWVDTRFSNAFRVRFGKSQVPFSYDRLTLVANILFVERGLTTNVAPDRDVGVQVLGSVAGSTVTYALALTNGVVDGGSSDTDGNDQKDVAARVLVRPLARRPSHPLSGLGLAVAASTGQQSGQLPVFLSAGRQPFFSYSGAVADGRRTRWSPQAFYHRGPFGAYGEYVRSTGGVRKADVRTDVDHDAWQVAASWVLTGETSVEQRSVRPRVNFDPPSRHFGALQLAARYQRLAVSRNAVALGLAAPTASRSAEAWTIGANWYLNPFIKWSVNVERTSFDDGSSQPRRPAETALLGRLHLGF